MIVCATSRSLDAGAIAGIVVAVFVVALIAAALGFWGYKKRQSEAQARAKGVEVLSNPTHYSSRMESQATLVTG